VINLDFDGKIEDVQNKGFYFESNQEHYLIQIFVKESETNCLVIINEIGIPQKNGETLTIKNGEEIASFEVEYFCEIDLWAKYYFPKFFSDKYQWYYDKENDKIKSMSEVMQFAIDLGLRIGNIKPN
jgi:hypothetical protein